MLMQWAVLLEGVLLAVLLEEVLQYVIVGDAHAVSGMTSIRDVFFFRDVVGWRDIGMWYSGAGRAHLLHDILQGALHQKPAGERGGLRSVLFLYSAFFVFSHRHIHPLQRAFFLGWQASFSSECDTLIYILIIYFFLGWQASFSREYVLSCYITPPGVYI